MAYNGVGEEGIGDPPREDGHLIGDATVNGHEETVVNGDMPLPVGRRHGCTGTVKVTEGDAWYVRLVRNMMSEIHSRLVAL